MASVIIGGAVNALEFSGANYIFSLLDKKRADEERIRHDKAVEKLTRIHDIDNRESLKKLDGYNKYHREEQEATRDINNTYEAAHQYYFATGGLKENLQLTDLYHPSEEQKLGEIIFITGGLGLVGYLLYKYM